MSKPERYFFDTDDDGHVYMIPASLKNKWLLWVSTSFNWEHELCVVFTDYKIDGGVYSYTFENPKRV